MENTTVDNYFVFKIKEGKQERYNEIVEQQLAITRNEPDTLIYKIFKTDDGLHFQHEQYTDEAACILHMKNTEKQLTEWSQITEMVQLVITGPISKEFREANNAENYKPYKQAK